MKKILFWLQPLLIFAGVYCAMAGFGAQMELRIDGGNMALIFLLASYGLMIVYRYLDQMPGGRWMGLMAVVVLEVVVFMRFFTAVVKGAQYTINHALKIFINYTGVKTELISYISNSRDLSEEYCNTIFLTMLGVLLIAIISFRFYHKRCAWIFLACTLPFILAPIVLGEVIFYGHMLGYILVAVAIIGSSHRRDSQVSTLVQYKVEGILIVAVVVCAIVSFLVVSPGKYAADHKSLSRIKQVFEDMESFGPDELTSWMKANFGSDAIDYGSVGNRNGVDHSGETILDIQSNDGLEGNVYLKGYVGDKFTDNYWKKFDATDAMARQESTDYLDAMNDLMDNWHKKLLEFTDNYYNTTQVSSGTNFDATGRAVSPESKMSIRNVGLGSGNRVLPYYSRSKYKYEDSGKLNFDSDSLYEVTYYPFLANFLISQNYAAYEKFRSTYIREGEERSLSESIRSYVRSHYLSVDKKYVQLFDDFFWNYGRSSVPFYVKDNREISDLPEGYSTTSMTVNEAITNVQKYMTSHATYSTTPGETPEGEDSIIYFMKTNKKGYCVHFASTAVMLFRSMGIPARYVEGVEVTLKERTKNLVRVKDNNAHAWVEIFRDDFGWVPVEVTPGMINNESAGLAPEEKEEPEQAEPEMTIEPQETEEPQEQESEDPMAVATQEPEEDTPQEEETQSDSEETGSSEEEEMDFDDIEEEGSSATGAAVSADGASSRKLPLVWKMVLYVLAAVLLIQGQYMLRKMLYNRGMIGSNRRNRIIRSYLLIVPFLRYYQVTFKDQSSADYIEQLAVVTGLESEVVEPFVTNLLKAQFGGDEMEAQEQKAFSQSRKLIVRRLYKKMPFIRRIFIRYVYGI